MQFNENSTDKRKNLKKWQFLNDSKFSWKVHSSRTVRAYSCHTTFSCMKLGNNCLAKI